MARWFTRRLKSWELEKMSSVRPIVNVFLLFYCRIKVRKLTFVGPLKVLSSVKSIIKGGVFLFGYSQIKVREHYLLV